MHRKIKIAFVIDTIDSPTGGTEKQLLLLIRHLDRERFEPYLCVLYVSPWLKDNFALCPMVEIGVTSFKKLETYRNIVKFCDFLKKEHVDIVQTHFTEANKVGIIAAKLAGINVIISARRNQGYWHTPFELFLLRILNRWATHYIANAESTRRWAAETENISLEMIDVIHNGIDLSVFSAVDGTCRSELRTELEVPADGILVGIVANLRPVKCIDVFIRAAALISDQLSRAYFVVVGESEGGEDLKLMNLARVLGISGKVRFLGKREDVPRILRCLDVGVLTSRSESFSNSVVEYLAAGLPVVCTDVGGAREAVEDGVNGYVVPPGDHAMVAQRILDVVMNGLLESMKNSSLEKARDLFSLPAMVSAHMDIYEHLVGECNA